MHARARLCARGDRTRPLGIGHRIEQRGRHLRAPRIVNAREDDRRHPRGPAGESQRNNRTADSAPTTCAATNAGTSTRRIPENVPVSARAIVTAGLANDVEAVNQDAAAVDAPTANGALSGFPREPRMTPIRPNVAPPPPS